MLSRITLTEELPWTKCLLSMTACQEKVHFIETFSENKKIKRLLKHLILKQSKYFVSVETNCFFLMQYNKSKLHFPSNKKNPTLGGMLPFHKKKKKKQFVLLFNAERNHSFNSLAALLSGFSSFVWL